MRKLIINKGKVCVMADLTTEEKKWFESLKRCLKKRPDSVEILVHEMFNSEDSIGSSIHLFKKGEINKSQTEVDDLMAYNPPDFSVADFTAEGVAANNHGY